MATMTCSPTPAALAPPAAASASSCASPAGPSSAKPAPQFAFASIRGSVCLVHCPTPPSALAAQELAVFRHEFISIFRFSHTTAVHPADFCLLERIDAQAAHYEEDSGTVFLARPTMDRLRKLTGPPRMRPAPSAPSTSPYASPRSRRISRGWPQA